MSQEHMNTVWGVYKDTTVPFNFQFNITYSTFSSPKPANYNIIWNISVLVKY